MANQYINIYNNNPTADAIDGSVVGSNRSEGNPVAVTLDASRNETKKIKLAVRCEEGYRTIENTIIQDAGDTDDRWKFSLAENGEFGDTITIAGSIGSVNTIFWAQASSDSLESPAKDTSVNIRLSTRIETVE